MPETTPGNPFSRLSIERKLLLVVGGLLLLVMTALSSMASLAVRRSARRAAAESPEIVRNYDGTIRLVLTDGVMPSMPGSTLVSRLETLRPGIKVLSMSGYTDDAVFRHGHLQRGRAFLQKPFTPEVLARKVREALKD